MPTEKTITLFTYDELSDKAKETAKQWWLDCRDETDYEFVIEDFAAIAVLLGIRLKEHPVKLMSGATRYDPNIWYSLAYCQGDYAAFEGTMRYTKGLAKEVRAYAPKDTALHALADRLVALHARTFYRSGYVITYHHYYGTQAEAEEFDWTESADERATEAKEIAKDLGQWLYDRLIEQDEYLRSDEQIAEAMAANEYTFREDGTRED